MHSRFMAAKTRASASSMKWGGAGAANSGSTRRTDRGFAAEGAPVPTESHRLTRRARTG